MERLMSMRYSFSKLNSFEVFEGDSWKKEYLPTAGFYGPIYPEAQFEGYQYFNNFKYQGATYRINSVVKLSQAAQKFLGIDTPHTQLIQHEITNKNLERWRYIQRKDDKKTFKVFTTVSPDQLIEEVIFPAEIITEPIAVEYYTDSEVPCVKRAWVLYVFAMLASVLFNDRLVMWGMFSVIFFAYRKDKLRKCRQHDYRYKK